MARTHEQITEELADFIRRQHLFFVASAPLSGEGHVNVSPKGLDCLRVLSPRRVAYADLTGSGNETSAHVAENGRLTLMFCAFEGKPMILRLYGMGRIILPPDPAWEDMSRSFPRLAGLRQIIVVEVDRVQTSCGFAVPLMEFVGDRDLLTDWAEKKGEEKLREYRREKNVRSIDGLPTPIGRKIEEG